MKKCQKFDKLPFFSLATYGCIQSEAVPVPLKHALTQRLSKPLCDRRSSGEPRLICLWLQKDLKHTRRPCSALINGSGEMLDEGVKKKCVCKTSTETLGFFNSLTILKDSPPQTCTHIYIHLINMDAHTVVG